MAQNLEDAIHNALLTRIRGTLFPKVSYDRITGARTTEAVATESAKSVGVQPLSTAYDEARDRSAWRREVVDWQWLVELGFSRTISTELFEIDLTHNPIKISRSDSGQDRQVLLALVDVAYENPPTGQPSSGTRVALRFTATLSPK